MHNRIAGTARVRDGRAAYGEPPTPSEQFPGEAILLDLPGADEHDMPLIVARFVALRAWSLRGEDNAVAAHAGSAARAHLDALPAWEEGRLLRRLVEGSGSPLQLLSAAADRAAARGHGAGARTLRQAAHRLRWRTTGFPPPSVS